MASKLVGHICSNPECEKEYPLGELPHDRRCTEPGCEGRITDLYEEVELDPPAVEPEVNQGKGWEVNLITY